MSKNKISTLYRVMHSPSKGLFLKHCVVTSGLGHDTRFLVSDKRLRVPNEEDRG